GNDVAADPAAPIGLERRAQAAVGPFHQTARLGLLCHFEHDLSDLQPVTLPRRLDPFDIEIGAARGPRQMGANLEAGSFPTLAKQHRDLAIGLFSPRIPCNSRRNAHAGFGNFRERGSFYSRTRYANQAAHCFTPSEIAFDKNYILLLYLVARRRA